MKNDQPLRLLLKAADARAAPAELPPPEQMIRLARGERARRRARRMSTSVAAAVGLLLVLAAAWRPQGAALRPVRVRPAGPQIVARETDLRAARERMVELDTRAAIVRAVAWRTEKLLEQQPAALEPSLPALREPEPSLVSVAQEEADRAAQTLVTRAVLMARNPRWRSDAIARLESVTHLFSESPWAVVARQELARLQ